MNSKRKEPSFGGVPSAAESRLRCARGVPIEIEIEIEIGSRLGRIPPTPPWVAFWKWCPGLERPASPLFI